ncbi:MAG: hypothetical protein M3416_00580 [Acidobacteriota bacterium]|nr:hypothetical protein [Acidobacteriota bacterium]
MNRHEGLHWLRDRILPTLVAAPPKEAAPGPAWPETLPCALETLEAAYDALKDELKSQEERAKTVETRLLSISSLAPVSMTIIVAVITFLTGDRAGEFTWASVLAVGLMASYVAFQFLVALLAAVSGLGRRSFHHLDFKDIVPRPGEGKDAYLQRACAALTEVILHNRRVVDEKVSQLALGHEAVKNAVCGLLLVLLTVMVITAFGTYW